jgi:hypothetical protein
MLNYTDLMYAQVKSHQDDLLASAAKHQLLKSARAWRKACRAAASERKTAGRSVTGRAAGVGAATFAGNLAACGQHVAGSAR